MKPQQPTGPLSFPENILPAQHGVEGTGSDKEIV